MLRKVHKRSAHLYEVPHPSKPDKSFLHVKTKIKHPPHHPPTTSTSKGQKEREKKIILSKTNLHAHYLISPPHPSTHTLRWVPFSWRQGGRFPSKKKQQQMLKRSIFYYSFRISLQPSPVCNQPLNMFGLIHATLQQNDCTSCTFLVTLKHWVKVKIIHTSIKIESLAMSIIIPSLKHIGSHASNSKLVLTIFSSKIIEMEFSSLNVNHPKVSWS